MKDRGKLLADHLGLNLPKYEGHDLAGPCPTCDSSDAFRLHREKGIAQCYSCGGSWSPLQLAQEVLNDAIAAKDLLIELQFLPPQIQTAHEMEIDVLEVIARQKRITADSLRAFGATVVSKTSIELPAYDERGQRCTSFTLSTRGQKGLFAKGKPAGLFFPYQDGQVRLPQPGETWHLVEGCKDAAALHALGLLACGLNTNHLAAKFARLFRGCDILLVPDRDNAGEEGATHSIKVLRGLAASLKLAELPLPFEETGGPDVRDLLRKPEGEAQLRQALRDAKLIEQSASVEAVQIPEGPTVRLTVQPGKNSTARTVRVDWEGGEFVDRLNPESAAARERFLRKLAEKLQLDKESLLQTLEPVLLKRLAEASCSANNSDQEEKGSQATIAVELAAEWGLWHSPDRKPFATIPVGDHKEVWPIRSQAVKQLLAKRFFDEEDAAMGSEAISAAINLLEAKALFEGPEQAVSLRVAEHEEAIYLDLVQPDWSVVRVTASGWEVCSESPVAFRRARGMLPLPTPECGGHVDQLFELISVEPSSRPLLIGWLLGCFQPRGPYPVLALFAEQGSGKSTTARLLRGLIDPNAAMLRSEPMQNRDLMIAAHNSWCLAYDNLSHIPAWLSDAMCRLSTGGGFTTRELYTDNEETILDSQRPLMLTSIEEIATRSDLLDRCLVVWLPAIPENRRRTESELLAAFHEILPRLLGALLDAASAALRNLPSTQLDDLPRMADFALWVTAAESALGWQRGTFLEAYHQNRGVANQLALESSVVAAPLMGLLEEHGCWDGTASELLEHLRAEVPEAVPRQRSWPKNARSLSGILKRLSPNLKAAGWRVDFFRTKQERRILIAPTGSFASPEDFASPFASPQSECKPPPVAAINGQLASGDANDANDANAGTSLWEQNCTTWEEGEL